jgi:hypothetical protein
LSRKGSGLGTIKIIAGLFEDRVIAEHTIFLLPLIIPSLTTIELAELDFYRPNDQVISLSLTLGILFIFRVPGTSRMGDRIAVRKLKISDKIEGV